MQEELAKLIRGFQFKIFRVQLTNLIGCNKNHVMISSSGTAHFFDSLTCSGYETYFIFK